MNDKALVDEARTKKWRDWLEDWQKDKNMSGQQVKDMAELGQRLLAFDLFLALMSHLNGEDMEELEKISDETIAKQRLLELFEERTGMSLKAWLEKNEEKLLQTKPN